MLEKYYIKPDTIDRIRSSWIAGAIEQYVAILTEQKYTARSILKRVPVLVQFGEFARKHGAKSLEELPQYVATFVQLWVKKHGQNCQNERARKKVAFEASNPIHHMLRLAIQGYDGGRRSKYTTDPFTSNANGFFSYLSNERGLTAASINHYAHFLRSFEKYLKKIDCSYLSSLSPAILTGFITGSSASLSKSSLIGLCCTLRVFLRYLFREQLINRDLSNSIESPQVYALSDLPRFITWGEVRQMLDCVDRRMPVGRRNYAVLLLLVVYGLRAREVAALTLDDIDWKRERLRVPERKAGHFSNYPLSPLVGQAILAYLQKDRPATSDRHLFFRVVAPYLPLTMSGISILTSKYLRKAGISVRRPGSHTLRHTCVQNLLDNNFPLKTIGDYVGHRSADSTKIYTKVAIESLREVACGDGEEIV